MPAFDTDMLDYQMDEDDYVAFQDHHARTSPAMRKSLNRGRYGLGVVMALLAVFFGIGGSTGWAIGYVVAAALWFTLYPACYRRALRRRALKLSREGDNKMFYGPRRISLEGDEVVTTSASSTIRFKASSITRVDSTEQYLFIYLSAIMAGIIPKSKVWSGDIVSFEKQLRSAAGGAGLTSD